MLILGILSAYGLLLAVLWVWSLQHAITTPREDFSRRGLWSLTILINPLASMWYWYIWKRWAFWTLFLPILILATFIRPILHETILTLAERDLADRFVSIMGVILNQILHAIPLPILVPLVAFPFIFRLAALAHLGGSNELSAADRNDYAITFSLPIFGFGAAMAYCLKWRRGWALVGLIWFLLLSGVCWSFLRYI